MTVDYPIAIDPSDLPPADSPTLELHPASVKEARDASILNGKAWKGPLSIEEYLRREEHLCGQALSIDGGFTAWVLVDTARVEGQRTVLSACETIRKRCIVGEPDGTVRDVISHGIGSVFCREEYRGRGYAQRMIQELRGMLKQWQQNEGQEAMFNVLYSDIGKHFYAKLGWLPYSSRHVSLRPRQSHKENLGMAASQPILDHDLDILCEIDENNLRKYLRTTRSQESVARVIQAPAADVMRWHHAREEFLAERLRMQKPLVKGACVRMANGKRVWAIWTRTFQENEAENTLHILRIVVEDAEPYSDVDGEQGSLALGKDDAKTAAIAACLEAAKIEASSWRMATIEVWNPSPNVMSAAKILEPDCKIHDRDTYSIPSLLWYGPAGEREPEWICNEKYAWC